VGELHVGGHEEDSVVTSALIDSTVAPLRSVGICMAYSWSHGPAGAGGMGTTTCRLATLAQSRARRGCVGAMTTTSPISRALTRPDTGRPEGLRRAAGRPAGHPLGTSTRNNGTHSLIAALHSRFSLGAQRY